MSASATAIAQAVGANIVAKRKGLGIQQGALAERLGVTQSRVCAIEKGHKLATFEQLLQISDILGCTMTALFKGAEAESDAYRKGYEDGWRDRTDDIAAHLMRPRTGGAA